MGYCVHYAQDLNRNLKAYKKRSINKKRVIAFSAALLFTFALFIGKVRNFLWELWIPGDADITVAAFSEMLNEVKQGSSVSQAMQGFCKEILENG